METLEIDELVRGCQRKEPDAQRKLYKRIASKMFGVCLRYAANQTEAEDFLQDGFVKIFTKIDQFNFNGSFEGWARRIMVNCAIENCRKMNMLYTVDEIREYDTQLSADNVLSSISYNELLQIVQQLTPQYRTVFNLFAIEGYSHQEIGQMLNISESTSKSNLLRARNVLKDKIEELYGTHRKI